MKLDTISIITIIAILLSPLLAVLVSIWIQNRKERRHQQFSILSTLIATRHEFVTAENVRALNMIDLVFHKKSQVRKLWKEYYDMAGNKGLDNPTGYQQRTKKYIELITEMANAIGYRNISHLDVDRIYSPVGVWQHTEKIRELLDELLRVLKSTAQLQVVSRQEVDRQEENPESQ